MFPSGPEASSPWSVLPSGAGEASTSAGALALPAMRRRTPLLRTVLATTALLLACGLALLWLPVDRVVSASGVLAGGSTAVRAPLDARVERVLVRSGERVRAGDPLLVLESAQLASERARSEARIGALLERERALRTQLEHLRGVRIAHELELAEFELARAAMSEQAAERKLEALERLRPGGLVAELTWEDAQAEARLARLAHEQSRRALEALPKTQAATVDELEAQVAEAGRRLDELRLEAAELARREVLSTLVAPSEGVVSIFAPRELLGRRVLAGEELLRLGQSQAERFEGLVGELGRAHVAEGMPVKLRVEGYPWLLHGSLSGRTSHLGTRNAGAGFAVEVELEGDRRGLVLHEGMHATARILVEEAVPLWRLVLERVAGPE